MTTSHTPHFYYVEQYILLTGYVLGRRDVSDVEDRLWPYLELQVAVQQPGIWGQTHLHTRTVMYPQPMPEKPFVTEKKPGNTQTA